VRLDGFSYWAARPERQGCRGVSAALRYEMSQPVQMERSPPSP